MVYPDYQPVNDPAAQARFEALWQTKMDPKAGLTVVEITEAIHGDDILGLYIMGENPAMSDPNASHARAALAKLQHLVVRDIFLTETACYADVVLPASAWPEKDGTVTNSNRQVQMAARPCNHPVRPVRIFGSLNKWRKGWAWIGTTAGRNRCSRKCAQAWIPVAA